MSTTPWWRRVFAAIDREYERRIRAASNISEYGQVHHADHHTPEDDGFDEAEIVNVPRGTRVSAAPPRASAHSREE